MRILQLGVDPFLGWPSCPKWIFDCYALNILERNLSAMCLAPVMEHYLEINGYKRPESATEIFFSSDELDDMELNPCAGVDFVSYDNIQEIHAGQVCRLVSWYTNNNDMIHIHGNIAILDLQNYNVWTAISISTWHK